MLEKKQLEKYLKLCMASDADFAEIYEQKESSELIKTLNGKLEPKKMLRWSFAK